MIDKFTLDECKKSAEVLEIKIRTLEHAISQSESMINESKMDAKSLTVLRRKIASSFQDLETLYLLKQEKVDRPTT
ncbi:hypothetical protein EV10_0008 [Prochlorococcus marinus str. SS51]|uniref:Uncharacterized protein n=2 Tax=Prochlorococcaceae TaxID=2881426 RepID=Q7VCN1_PROMA|nr:MULTISPECIES: hypothetical protein [Prochlorococcus]AAP99753.1 Predicted protein [Prochlorococcus marinus subsp. marinus str. CCMP1375]KGG14463.1 hypothetical protein EV04_0040 [Prochlorococcus marinus str. LG]KGG22547.1 hypothetical protein EV08_0062 [Prochlorococcus marinus str. SS2]KGG24390.1 hypothetical protein EV09_0297 [Prochlorococcus marinus str. SS35]KGG34162.1 hypothetical protein EV10_0008 [Prochlorococcus marinus str. SS51]